MRTLLTRALIALAITTIGALGADNSIGAWKLNAEKSKYTPAPMPVKSLTVTREASDGGVKVTTTGEQTDGVAINSSYTAKFDRDQTSKRQLVHRRTQKDRWAVSGHEPPRDLKRR